MLWIMDYGKFVDDGPMSSGRWRYSDGLYTHPPIRVEGAHTSENSQARENYYYRMARCSFIIIVTIDDI